MTGTLVPTDSTVTHPEITVEQEDLVASLSALAKFVPSKPQNDALRGVLLAYDDDDGALVLSTTDGVTSAQVTLGSVGYDGPDPTENPVRVLAPAKMLLHIISGYPSGSLTLQFDDSNIYLISGKLRYKVVCQDKSAFPTLTFGEEFPWDKVPPATADDIVSGLNFAARAASKDNAKQNLQGVRVTIGSEGKISYFATDSKHMLESSKAYTGGYNVSEMTLPPEAIEAMSAMLTGTDKIRIVQHDGGFWICREDGSVKINVRAFKQKYPDMSPLMALKQNHAAVVNREDLLSTLNRMKAFITSNTQRLNCQFDGLFMTLSVFSADGEASEVISMSPYDGPVDFEDPDNEGFLDFPDDWNIGLRLIALSEALGNFHSDEIVIRATALNRPILIHGKDSSENSRYLTALIK